MHRESLCDGQVYSVCQRCDNESSIESHVLVAVFECSGALVHPNIIQIVNPVKPLQEIYTYV